MSLFEELSKDRRVVLYAVFVALAIISIGFFGLKFGLDLEGGSYLQLQLQGAEAQIDVSPEKILEMQFNASSVEKHGQSYVVTVPGIVESTFTDDLGYIGAKIAKGDNSTKITIMASPETIVINYLKKNLDADVQLNVAVAPIRYEIRTNVTRESLDALLAPVGGKVPPGEDAFVMGVSKETVDETKKVLDSKLNRLGLQDIKVRVVDNKYILIDLAGMDVAAAQEVVGKPGKFEIRIQTENNQSMHVLYGDAVESVEIPRENAMVDGEFPLFSRKRERWSSRRRRSIRVPPRDPRTITYPCTWIRMRSFPLLSPLSWQAVCRRLLPEACRQL